ncbi:MAG: hypothetical protein WC071_11315 [Victivallaceae bacterium]
MNNATAESGVPRRFATSSIGTLNIVQHEWHEITRKWCSVLALREYFSDSPSGNSVVIPEAVFSSPLIHVDSDFIEASKFYFCGVAKLQKTAKLTGNEGITDKTLLAFLIVQVKSARTSFIRNCWYLANSVVFFHNESLKKRIFKVS